MNSFQKVFIFVTRALLPFGVLTALTMFAYANPVAEEDWWGEPTIEVHNARLTQEKNVPTWTAADAKAFPQCAEGDPATAGLVNYVVVMQDGSRVFMTFGDAWDRGHDDNRANDVWLIGVCA